MPAKIETVEQYTERLRQRFERCVDRTPGQGVAGECHLWTGCRGGTNEKYGSIYAFGRHQYAHRVAWFLAHGEWPPARVMVLHAPKVCHNGLCCNEEHLRLGGARENLLDQTMDGTHRNAIKTHCPQGHAYDAGNTYIGSRGGRFCRECDRAKNRRIYATDAYREKERARAKRRRAAKRGDDAAYKLTH